MATNVIDDKRSATSADYIDKNVGGYGWPDISMNDIPVKIQRQKEESVRVSCSNAV